MRTKIEIIYGPPIMEEIRQIPIKTTMKLEEE
jgi:hypothetical protein